MEHSLAVILDVDGTLVDSNDAHAESWARALSEEGLHFPVEQVRKLIGMGGDQLLPTLTGMSEDSETGKKIAHRRAEIFKSEYLNSLKAFPEARELLAKMRADGLLLAIATSGSREDLQKLLKITGLDEVVLKPSPIPVITKDDVEDSKPSPDLIEAALRKLGVPPQNAYMLGDTPYDIHAAKMARVKTIALRCGGWGDAGLTGAVGIYDDPADLLRHWGESPLGGMLRAG
jgi:HAD superfamily hydrolase (TIGR01549 family)